MIDDFSITVSELEAERIRGERLTTATAQAQANADELAAQRHAVTEVRAKLDSLHVSEADEQRATAALSVKLDAIWQMFTPAQKAREIKRWLICERGGR
jgi:hypothetical protein